MDQFDPLTLRKIAEEIMTPVYVYSEERLLDNIRTFTSAYKNRYPKVKVVYAYKANTSLALCSLLRKEGAGADVVSGGELHTALKVGVSGKDIIFSSNAKTDEELNSALDAGIIINLDSVQELEVLQELASKKNKKARVSFRLNPNIDPKTHPKIATGLKTTKFGLHIEKDIAYEAYRKASEMQNIEIVGAQIHIGSQIKEIQSFVDAAEKLMEFVFGLKDRLGLNLEFIDLGGGLGVPYQDEKFPTPDDVAKAVVPVIEKWNKKLGYEPELWLEPGRYVAANAGILLSEVQSVKETPYKKFINLNAGFNTLIRPAMYDAYHKITVVGKEHWEANILYDIAGNVCETGDLFAKDRRLPKTDRGDIIAIHDVGAYGFSMASRYNTRPLPTEVLIRKDKSYELIREKERIEDSYVYQKIPKDLI
jgi:diaminopimelate decarboxylase